MDFDTLHKDDKKKAKEERDEIGRWLPGYSPNPKGRPRGAVSISAKIKKYLSDHPEEVTAVARALIKLAKSGNMTAIKELMVRIDGKVAETHKIDFENPVTIEFVPAATILGKKVEVIDATEVKSLPEGEA